MILIVSDETVIYRGLVKWYDRSLQNFWWEFDSLIPCYKNTVSKYGVFFVLCSISCCIFYIYKNKMNYSRLMNELADPIVFPHFHKMADIRHQILPEWRTFLIPFFLFLNYNIKKAGICVDMCKCIAEKQNYENCCL